MKDSADADHSASSVLDRVPGAVVAQALRTLREHRDRLAERFAVRSLALFGSVARGEAGADSDVDLLVEFSRPIGLLHVSATALFLEEVLGRPVDLVLRRALLPAAGAIPAEGSTCNSCRKRP